MKELNKLRLLSGIPIDTSIEVTEKKEVVTEARAVPRKSDRAPKDEKSLTKGIACLQTAVKHIKLGIKALDKVPATNYMGDVPEFIQQLEDVVSGGKDGLESYLKMCEKELREFKRATKPKKPLKEDEEDMRSSSARRRAQLKNELEDDEDIEAEIEESMHFFANMDKDNEEEDDAKPINVSDGSSNDEQVWDEPNDPKNDKDEHNQLRTSDEKSEQDQSDGADIETDFKVPASIKTSLRTEIGHIKKEAEKLNVNSKDASYFYKDLARAFEDLADHLDKGTLYDFKLAQTYAQSLMGPMLHKLPADVWKFIANGGQTRSLKDYMKPVKDPITGPRNTIK